MAMGLAWESDQSVVSYQQLSRVSCTVVLYYVVQYAGSR